MAFNPRGQSNYLVSLRQLLRGNEGFREDVYQPNDHVPTIGYGFTFVRRGTGNVWGLYERLDIDLAAINRTLTSTQRTTLQNIADALNSGAYALADTYIGQFSSSFGTINEGNAQTLFTQDVEYRGTLIRNHFRQVLGQANGATLFDRLVGTTEMMAVFDIAYFRGAGGLTANLITAMAQMDRVTAWYEIRYRELPPNPEPGHALRNYRNSNLFSLYEVPGIAATSEAQEIYRLYAQNRVAMDAYESMYPPRDAGTNLITVLQPAKAAIFDWLRTTKQISLDSDAYSALDLMLAFDTGQVLDGSYGDSRNAANVLIGDVGADRLSGGLGDDVLIGFGGADSLDGGAGSDTYIYLTGDGSDTITDSDGSGQIKFDQDILKGGKRPAGSGSPYVSHDGKYSYVWSGGDLVVNEVITIKNFKNKDLGIYLDEIPEPPDPDGSNGGGGGGGEGGQSPANAPRYNPWSALRFPFISPIALDLNNNGRLDDISLQYAKAYFDLTEDGIAEKTGWLGPADGFLALDVNGNGVIDDRSELFGKDGQKSAFLQLAERADSNHDGVITSADQLFGSLRIWQDVNGDGISQSSELKTLDELGITSVDTAETAVQYDTSNGNRIVGTGSYVRNGEQHYLADIEFAYDPVITDANPVRSLDEELALDADVYQLPWLRGYGFVKSLHIAYQEDPSLREAAKSLIGQGYEAILDNFASFMAKWTGLEAAHAAAGVTRTNITLEDKVWMLEVLTGQAIQKSAIEAAAFGSIGPVSPNWRTAVWNEGPIARQWRAFMEQEAATFALQATTGDWLKGAYYSLNADAYIVVNDEMLTQSLMDKLQAIGALSDALAAGQLLQRLQSDGVELQDIKNAIANSQLEFSEIYLAAIDGRFAWRVDGGDYSASIGLDSFGTGTSYLGPADDLIAYRATDNRNWWVTGSRADDILLGANGDDVLVGGAGNDQLLGGGGSDKYFFSRGDGVDTILDWGGDADTLKFGLGISSDDIVFSRDGLDMLLSIAGSNDQIRIKDWRGVGSTRIERMEFADGTVWEKADITALTDAVPIVGSDQDDQIRGDSGNNIFHGGLGNDVVQGETGSDVYRFNLGDGQDIVWDYDYSTANIDTIRFGSGIAAADISASRRGEDLILHVAGSTDQIQIQNWAIGQEHRIERIEFFDGTIWNATELQQLVDALMGTPLVGTAADDSIRAWQGENSDLRGLGGNDVLYGRDGNDRLEGGAGSDVLSGGVGNDTYLFNLGDGQDTISDDDSTAGNIDTLRFGSGISAGDVSASRNGYDLILSIAGGTDRVLIQNWGQRSSARIEQVEFADGTVWNSSQLNGMVAALMGIPIIGTENADTLRAWSDEDANLQGEGGNDHLYGDQGDDTLDGGAGDDYLSGGAGDDELEGGAGNDVLIGGIGNDTYLFSLGDGQDTISDDDSTVGNVDTLRFSAGISAGDVSVSRDGYDLILSIAGGTDRVLIKNWGQHGSAHIERVEFVDGTVWDSSQLNGRVAALMGIPIIGTENADTLRAWSDENANLQGEGGNDHLYGDQGDDTLDGGAGDDYLSGGTGDDDLEGGAGNDALSGDAGNDTYLFNLGDGQDTIHDGDSVVGNVDTLRFGTGISSGDISLGRINDDLLFVVNGTTDQVRIKNWGSGDVYRIERVEFDDGTVWDAIQLQTLVVDLPIMGTAGADNLVGDTANNIFNGGAGNDVLSGGIGNDTYLFNLDDGQDTIIDTDYTVGHVDTLRFGVGISTSDVSVSRNGYDLILSITGGTDRVLIQNWGQHGAARIERVEFADGAAWDASQLNGMVAALMGIPVVGTEGADILRAWPNENANLQGEGGNDFLSGNDGNDTLNGGAGNDQLIGDQGNDVLAGGADNDSLSGDAGDDVYQFNLGDGQDTIYEFDGTAGNIDTVRFGVGISAGNISLSRTGNDLLFVVNGTTDQVRIKNWGSGDAYRIERVEFDDGTVWDAIQLQTQVSSLSVIGTEADDQLYGDASNNTFIGNAGNDYLVGATGNDTYLFNLGDGQDTINDGDGTIGNIDTLRFGVGIAASDISVSRNLYDLIVGINGSTDRVRIQNWGDGKSYRVERFEFEDGTVWSAADIKARAFAVSPIGTSGSDNLVAWHEEAANLQGLNGNDALQGNDQNDTLIGGGGNDGLYGGSGDDTYIFNLGDGQDTIYDADATAGNLDTLRFGAGISPEGITVSRSGVDVTLSINGTTDRVLIQGWGNHGGTYRIERVEFADSTVWGLSDLLARIAAAPIVGTEGKDSLQGWSGETTSLHLQGLAGSDALYGGDGDDVLNGGAGDDSLQGGAGNDIYVFNLGDGQDTLAEVGNAVGGGDELSFGPGISSSSITFTRNGNDLLLSIDGTTDQVRIRNWGGDESYRIERVVFADGTLWEIPYLLTRTATAPIVGTAGSDYLRPWQGETTAVQIQGLEGNDSLYGSAGDDALDGGVGNDYLAGNNGNDTLSGGVGKDLLIGGTGNDTYVFNLGDGQDTISDVDSTSGNVDTLRFGAGIFASDITFSRNKNDLILSISGTTDQVRLQDWGYGNNYRIELVEFDDGTVWDATQFQTLAAAATITGTVESDNLYGDAADNTFHGGIGDDYQVGSAGNDTYLFNLGDGQDTISDEDGGAGSIDTLRFGLNILAADIIFARDGDDLILSINGTVDQVRFQNWGSGDYYRIERVEFFDGTVWNEADLQQKIEELSAIETGTEGADYLRAWQGINAELVGLGGDDYLAGSTGDDTLEGGAGNDTLDGGAGNDTYIFNLGDGQDTIVDTVSTDGEVDTVRFGVGISAEDVKVSRRGDGLLLSISGSTDQLYIQWSTIGVNRIERVVFADGTEWDANHLQLLSEAAPIIGTDDSDYLYARQGHSDTLLGLDGDDRLYGNDKNDVLHGGLGNDFLYGGNNYGYGNGSDVYLFNLGDGQDTLLEGTGAAGEVDVIRFGEGISEADVEIWRDGSQLLLKISGTSDQIRIQNWTSGYHIERIEFRDGTTWDDAYLDANAVPVPVVATEGADVLVGAPGVNNVLSGLGGDDSLYGNTGDDTLTGGTGNDYLVGGDDNGSGNGADTYIFNRGDGADQISDGDFNSTSIDTLRFGADILSTEVSISRLAMDLVLRINGTADQVRIVNWGYGSAWRIEQVEFADGTVWDAGYLHAQALAVQLVGTGVDDYLQSWVGENANLMGLGGDDHLSGSTGNDTLEGGAGADYLSGGDGGGGYGGYGGAATGNGNDTYVFNLGDGQDTIFDFDAYGDNVDTIRFGVGISAEDIILTGVIGTSDLVVRINGTEDQIRILSSTYSEAYQIERIEFADGTVWDAEYFRSLVDATLYPPIIGTEGSDNLYAVQGENSNLQGLGGDDYLFGNSGRDRLNGGAGNDALYGENGNDTLEGGSEGDYLSGGIGDDVLIGGTGDDQLAGGRGNDIYVFNLGDGQDVVSNQGDIADETDILLFGEGIYATDISFSRRERDLILNIHGTDGWISVQGWGHGEGAHIDQIAFADGTVWDYNTLLNYVAELVGEPVFGTEAGDYLTAWAGEDAILLGLEGDDEIEGEEGNDILEGGLGDDYLYGGSGSDVYVFNLGDGEDTVEDDDEDGAVDTLRFGSGIAGADISLSLDGADLILSINGTSDQVRLQYWANGDEFRIEQVQFDDGTVWDRSEVQRLLNLSEPLVRLDGTSENDELWGTTGNDLLVGGAGDDYLYGDLGSDTYLFNIGDGQDTIDEWNDDLEGINTLKFGEGIAASDIDFLRSEGDLVLSIAGTDDQVHILDWGIGDGGHIKRVVFADGVVWDYQYLLDRADELLGASLSGTADADYLVAWFGEDAVLQGLAGDDELVGSDGNDTLEGGLGDDYLYGGSGDDRYVFNLGDGQDTIDEWHEGLEEINTLQFGSGITPADIDFARSGNDLVLAVTGTDDLVRIQSWGVSAERHIERVVFADETVWDYQHLLNRVEEFLGIPLIGTADSDYLMAWSGEDAVLQGLDGNDELLGSDGDDTFDGGTGDDNFYGGNSYGAGNGSDTYLFQRGYGVDTIDDFDEIMVDTDIVAFDASVGGEQLWFSQAGMNLEISIIGTTDKMVVRNWYYGNQFRIEEFVTSDGQVLLESQVQNLVDAMAAFTPPAAGETTLPTGYASTLTPVIAANWQQP